MDKVLVITPTEGSEYRHEWRSVPPRPADHTNITDREWRAMWVQAENVRLRSKDRRAVVLGSMDDIGGYLVGIGVKLLDAIEAHPGDTGLAEARAKVLAIGHALGATGPVLCGEELDPETKAACLAALRELDR